MQDRHIKLSMICLRTYRHGLTPQQYKTLRGQILAGDPVGAIKGLQKILTRGTRP